MSVLRRGEPGLRPPPLRNPTFPPRGNQWRMTLPHWDASDEDSKKAFLIVIAGALLCPPLHLLNLHTAFNSPIKRARRYALRSVLLLLPYIVLVLVLLLGLLSPTLDLSETVTRAPATCAGTPCCAAKGQLVRYMQMCSDVGFIDPTGQRCVADTFGICVWTNGTVTSTMDIHCHGELCHYHKAPHVTGNEPGDVD